MGNGKLLWTIIGAPIIQELIFRFIPYKFFYLPIGNYWQIGIASSLIFALTHWYFGKWFIVASFFAGLLYWWSMVNFGLVAAILTHSSVNIAWLVSKKFLKK